MLSRSLGSARFGSQKTELRAEVTAQQKLDRLEAKFKTGLGALRGSLEKSLRERDHIIATLVSEW